MNNAPIGIFDSGLGGLTVARAVIDKLPDEEIIYLGDTEHTPYGPRAIAQVRSLTLSALDELASRGVKALVIACNTATAAALADARERSRVGAGRQCVACLRPQRICHKKVARQGASRVEELPSHRTRCDLPEHVLPGLKGRVDARWCRFVGAEEVGGELVCQVISDLGEPSADHGSSQLDSFLAVLGEGGS